MKKRLRFLTGWLVCLLMCLAAVGAMGEDVLHSVESGLIADGVLHSHSESMDVVLKVSDKQFAAYMLPKLEKLPGEIDVSHFGLSPDDFYMIYNRMLNLNPEYFYITGGYSYYYRNGIITSILPDYRYPVSTIPKRIKQFEASVDKIAADARKATTQVGQMLRVYDYFCAHYAYDETYTRYRPEELFETNSGVCNAYALAYCAVLNELGVTNDYTISKAMNHIWNLVKLDGKWYHIDVTWGDPITDMPLRINHKNFLRSDAGITDAGHYAWDTKIKASSTKYDNYFWQMVEHPVCLQGDVAYYVDTNFSHPKRTIYAHDLTTGKSKAFYQYNYKLNGSYYPSYNPVWVVDTDIYFVCGNELYHASAQGGKETRILSTGSGTMVWGIYQEGDQLKLYAATGYAVNGKIHTYTLSTNCQIDLEKDSVQTTVGKKTTLKYTITPNVGISLKVKWSYSPADKSYVKMDGNKMTALKPGVITLTATLPNGKSDSLQVLIRADKPLCIPSGTKVIDAETFRGVGAMEIIVPDGAKRIESRAFAACTQLRLLYLPDSLVYIAPDAFLGADLSKLYILCATDNGFAARFAQANGIPYMVQPAK